VTGLNERGGLSITLGPDGLPDGNPEAVMISRPLDGTRNPKVMLGAVLEEFDGVVDYQHGYFNILPITTPKVVGKPDVTVPATKIKALEDDACAIRFGDYNIENMSPRSHHLPIVAGHIAKQLLHPDIMFLQEVQDNSGRGNDGTTSANITLSRLAKAVGEASSDGLRYNFTNIDPLNNQDGGIPGGNIRTAYLYNPSKVSLVPGSAGGAEDATTPLLKDGGLSLSFNPGRIDPTNDAWFETRKPLVAHWITPEGASFFTINHHGKSKGGSSSTHGDARPPVNAWVERRTAQVQVIADFIASILALDPSASIILAGDFNEYTQTHSVVAPLEGLMHDADAAAGMPETERYTYVFDQNCQQIDHIYVSSAIADRGVQAEHVHVNNWAESLSVRASDHDPSVGMVRVC
ncbi:DNase I-like protein, partial [Peniophora sp. CONT]